MARDLVGVAAMAILVYTTVLYVEYRMQESPSLNGSVDDEVLQSAKPHLRAELREFVSKEPPMASARSEGAPKTPVAFYYKCTLTSDRCVAAAKRFDGDPHQLVLVYDAPFDANITAASLELAVQIPGVRAYFDAGANDFGLYKKFGYNSLEFISRGVWAQRRKMRSVFEHFFEQQPVIAAWMCYFDSDMIIGSRALIAELTQQPKAGCRRNCWIGSVAQWVYWKLKNFKKSANELSGLVYTYTQGGFCMDRELARRVYKVFKRTNDTDIYGDRRYADDIGLAWLMKGRFAVTPTDSASWHTQLHNFCTTPNGTMTKFRGWDAGMRLGCTPQCASQSEPTVCQNMSVYHEPCRVYPNCVPAVE
jgi:hypothetical protein